MKVLVMGLALAIVPLLYLLWLRLTHNRHTAALLTITAITSPFLVGNATDIMTEAPYLFWSVISLMLICKYDLSKSFSLGTYMAVMGAIIMTYLTRSVGVGLFIAMIAFLLWNVPWTSLGSKDRLLQAWRSEWFRKLIYVMAPLFIGAVIVQWWQASKGVSQASLFFGRRLSESLEINGDSLLRVAAQMLFSRDAFKFQNFYAGVSLPPLNVLYTALLIVLVWGMFKAIRRGALVGSYAAIVALLIVLASMTPAEMVLMRYLSVLIPFMIYFVLLGGQDVFSRLLKWIRVPRHAEFGRLAGLLLLTQVLLTNFHGNMVNIRLASLGHGPTYLDYVDVSQWARNNLPDSAVVLAIKPRIFYVFSGKKALRLTSLEDAHTPEFTMETIDWYRSRGVTHMILDGISAATRQNVLPVVTDNPDRFQTLYVGSTSGSSSMVRIKY